MNSRKEDVKKTYRLRGAKPGMTLRWLLPFTLIMIAAMGWLVWERQSTPPKRMDATVEDVAAVEQDRVDLALASARVWSADAVLAKISSGGESPDTWEYVFSSASKKGKLFLVTIMGGTVASTGETVGVVSGGAVPENLISSEEAIAKARMIPGYENVQIVGVEMIYGPDGMQWYWGVKTNRGVVSIKATK